MATYAELKKSKQGKSSSSSGSSSVKSSTYASLKKAAQPRLGEVRKYLEERNRSVRMQSLFDNAVAKAQADQEKANKAFQTVSRLETIAGLPKQIYQIGKESAAAGFDIASRLSPAEAGRNIFTGIKSAVQRPKGVSMFDAYNQGVQQSRARETAFEKVSGKQLTNPDGSINWDAQRTFLGRAMELPTYVFGAPIRAASLADTGLLTRILTRTKDVAPEVGVITGLQQFEQGNLENVGTNLLANALLMSGIGNIAGEVKLSRSQLRKGVSDVEREVGNLSLREKFNVKEALEQGIDAKEIATNARKIKNNEFSPDDVADRINKTIEKEFGVQEKPVKIETDQQPKSGDVQDFKPVEKTSKPTKVESPESIKVQPAKTSVEPPTSSRLTSIPGTGATKVRGASKTLERRAIEEGISTAFSRHREYKSVSLRNQKARVSSELIEKDFDKAVRVAMGEVDPPEGVIPEMVLEGVIRSNRADAPLLKRLASKSALIEEATTMGQRIRAWAEISPHSPVKVMRDVIKAREKNTGKGSVEKKSRKEAQKARKATQEAFTVDDAQKLFDKLTC